MAEAAAGFLAQPAAKHRAAASPARSKEPRRGPGGRCSGRAHREPEQRPLGALT